MNNQYFTVKSKVEIFPGKGGWTYVKIPKEFTDMSRSLANRGLVPTIAKVGNTEWKTSLLPFGDGRHFIALNQKVRKLESIKVGDKIEVSFKFNI